MAMFRERQADELDPWIEDVLACGVPALQNFAALEQWSGRGASQPTQIHQTSNVWSSELRFAAPARFTPTLTILTNKPAEQPFSA
jgi:hypothetical protein